MARIDWSILSGPHVSRRTLLSVAAATGAVGYAQRLAGLDAVAARAVASRRTPRRQEPTQGGTLRIGLQLTQIVTLDPPLLTQGIVAGSILPSIHSSLVMFDTELGIVGDLAESWDVSEDGKEYVFHLRPGLTFHNGDPLTANDFVYTYQRTTNPDFASPHANKLGLITEFTAPDDVTISLKMSEPFAPFLGVACTRGPGRALTPISQRAITELGDEQFGVTPVGSGPFMVVPETVEVGKGLELVPFEAWYGGRPYLDRLVIQLIPEPSSQVSALEAGDIDLMDPVPATVIGQVRDNPDFVFIEAPGTNWRGLAMNQARPPWDNFDARLAVTKAIDRADFVQKAFLGNAVPSVGPIAPAFAWVYRPPSEVDNPQDFNLEEAKALAEKAGLVGLKPNALAAEDTIRPTEALRVALAEIGIELQIENLQQAAYTERWTQGDFDTFIHGSTVDADPDDGHWNFFYSEGPWNVYGYKSEKADELLRGTRSTADPELRKQYYQELQTLLETEVPMAFLYHLPDFVAYRAALQDYLPIPEQRYYEKVWLDE